MGCASSKQSRCKHCQSPYSPLSRSYSVPIHHPAQSKGDSYHVVALTSSTLGSLKLNSNDQYQSHENGNHHHQTTTATNGDDNGKEFSIGVLQAKSWSSMINEKIPKVIPKTPIRTPPGEPETINTWELMEGLDDISPLRLPNRVDRSFSFHATSAHTHFDHSKARVKENGIRSPTVDVLEPKVEQNGFVPPPIDQFESRLQENGVRPQPEEYIFREIGTETPSLDQPKLKTEENGNGLSIVDHPKSEIQENGNGWCIVDHSKSEVHESGSESPTVESGNSEFLESENGSSPTPERLQTDETGLAFNLDSLVTDFDPEIISTFRKALEEISPVHPVYLRSPEKEKPAGNNHPLSKEFMEIKKGNNVIVPSSKCPPYGEDKVVIYFTSLRGVRKTYEDCCLVRVILKGFGVRVDERDVSMHYGFREELKEVLGAGFSGGLPKVFVNGQYIGGAEEIKQLNEDGELEKVVEGCAMVEDGDGGGVCEMCGDIRFLPCERCSGSCKIYCEDEDEWEGEDGVGAFQRCPDCNENGLVRCQACCY